MILDVQRRLELAFRELCLADPDIASFAGERIYTYGDQSHKAAYPCVLFNTVDANPSGDWRTGWYTVHFQLLGATYRPDDKDKAVMRQLVGALLGLCQRTDLAEALSSTRSARTPATAIHVENVAYENDVQDEDGQNGQIYSGVCVAVLCAPHTPDPLSPGESFSDSPSSSESAATSSGGPTPGTSGETL